DDRRLLELRSCHLGFLVRHLLRPGISHQMKTHLVSLKGYILTWLALLALAGLTILIGFANLGQFNILVAVAIAAAQASLLAAVYMHGLFGTTLIRVIAAGGIIWFLF